MDNCAAACLQFAPADFGNNHEYDEAIHQQLGSLSNLLKQPTAPLRVHGPQLLELLDPAVNSLAYLAVTHTLSIPALVEPRDVILEKLVVFLMTFDARQLRYAGQHLEDILNMVANGNILPPRVAVEVLAAAILRIDPSGSILTSTHVSLAKLAYESNNIEPALPVFDKSIVFYPNMANYKAPDQLCDLSLSPSIYISKETGLTANLKSTSVLEYDLLCGLSYCARRDWAKAHAAFERVVTYPTRDHGVSKIMVEAYKKWVLVSLLLYGKAAAPPSYTGMPAVRTYNTIGKLYKEIAAIFETEDAANLTSEVQKNTKDWQDDGNTGLIQEVLAAYQEWQIMNLELVYSKISIPEIRQLTKSAQTGTFLTQDADVETLIQNMVIQGRLKGVVEKNDDGTTFLTFLSSSTVLSEAEFARVLAGTASRLKALQPVFKATNERLGTNREYIKHLAKEQRSTFNGHDSSLGFDSNLDEEDLMSGVTST